jgi:hypothetical protein
VRGGALAIVVTVVMIIITQQAYAMEYEEENYATPWNIQEDTISVLIMRDASVPAHYLDIVENTIDSKEKSNTVFFESWNDGIREMNSIHNRNIPTLQVNNIHNQNYITIYLKEESHPKYNGFTQLTYDDNKIDSAFITIYNADELPSIQIETIVRHELGHALGISHLSGQPSIMNSIINQESSLISMFDLKFLLMAY